MPMASHQIYKAIYFVYIPGTSCRVAEVYLPNVELRRQ